MSTSVPYRLSQAVVAALRAAFEPGGFEVIDNPTALSDLAQWPRIVFVEDVRDRPGEQPGQAERRTFQLAVGVINRSSDSRLAADVDMQAAKPVIATALLRCARDLRAAGDLTGFSAPHEGERTYRVEGLDVGGALILTQFEFSYSTPAAPMAR